MSGKPGRGGRPKSAEPKRAYTVKLPLPEADAFDAYVRQRSERTTGSPDELSTAAVLRMIIRAAVEADSEAAPAKPKRTKK